MRRQAQLACDPPDGDRRTAVCVEMGFTRAVAGETAKDERLQHRGSRGNVILLVEKPAQFSLRKLDVLPRKKAIEENSGALVAKQSQECGTVRKAVGRGQA